MRPFGSPEELEARRRHALELMRRGCNDTQIAEALGCTARSVRRWRRQKRRRGQAGLNAKPASGRPRRLSARQRRSLVSRLTRGALACGWTTDLWTCPRIAELIDREFGVRYHVDAVPRLMAALGFSCQKPERLAVERDEAAIRHWVAVDWPRIKKRATPPRAPGFHR